MLSRHLDTLAEAVSAGLDSAMLGSRELAWIDFPDFANVGDSAIWLGLDAWAKAGGLRVVATVPTRATTRERVRHLVDRGVVPVVNGGGNFGGLWPEHHQARLAALEGCAGAHLVQAPQSVAFVDEGRADEIQTRAAAVGTFKMLVRDKVSQELVAPFVSAELTPDAAHMLGSLDAPPPSRPSLVLARRDKESRLEEELPSCAIDWIHEPANLGDATRKVWLRAASKRSDLCLPATGTLRRVAMRRLARGVAALSQGEVVVTDRLHAMILALQMGRRVVAVDNNVQKLTRYAARWLDHPSVPLEFTDNLRDATRLAERGG